MAIPSTVSDTRSLAEDERLDELDPLRHLRQDDIDDLNHDVALVPVQPPSILGETHTHRFSDNFIIDLLVDASPGCGGLAWPAGSVSPSGPSAREISHG